MAGPGVLERVNEWLGRGTWPPPGIREVWDEVDLAAAFRLSDATRLRQEASVAHNRPYLLTPLPRLISRGSSNLLFGEPPVVTPATESDQDATNLERIISDNGLESELVRGALISSSEGEVWGRVIVQPSLLDCPIIEFVSRARVIPHFVGRFLAGATFVSSWATSHTERYRLFETYEAGAVSARLFKGTTTALGTEVDLDGFGPTEGMEPVVLTGIEKPLVAFIPNSIDADPTRGYSDYRGLEDRFLAINSGYTIGQQNLKLSGRKRALVDGDYINEDGNFNDADDVLVRKAREATMGEQAKPLEILEYTFEAQAVIAWCDALVDSSLLLAGIAPQAVGRAVDGGAISGTALRLKMAHSLIEASGKGRHQVRGLKHLLRCAAIIDSRPTTQGGFGRKWSSPDEDPNVDLQDGLPQDDLEAAQILVALVNAEAISVEERIRFAHPEWDEEKVQDELSKLQERATELNAAAAVTRPPLTIGQPPTETPAPPELQPAE